MDRARDGFTLLEVLMAFIAGSMLIGIIYFFHFGMLVSGRKSQDRMELNAACEIALEAIARDLRLTYRVVELKQDRLLLDTVIPVAEPGESFDPSDLKLRAVEYRIEGASEASARLHRREGLDQPRDLVIVSSIGREVFSGLVLDMPREKEDPFPRYHPFDSVSHPSSELTRITLVRVHLAMTQGKDQMGVHAKFFLPLAFNRTVQADWNVQ